MKSCLIIINKSAGGSSKVSFEKVERCLGDEYNYTRCAIPDNPDPNPEGYDAVAVCGGDGTLGSVLSKIYDKPIDVWYFPVGTLNDKAKAERYLAAKTSCPACGGAPKGKQIVIGKCGDIQDHIFAYVFAAGAFTPIGYTAKVENKKKHGVLGYARIQGSPHKRDHRLRREKLQRRICAHYVCKIPEVLRLQL